MARMGAKGTVTGLTGGMTISVPSIINFASEALKAKVIPPVLAGKKRMALAITEVSNGQWSHICSLCSIFLS